MVEEEEAAAVDRAAAVAEAGLVEASRSGYVLERGVDRKSVV